MQFEAAYFESEVREGFYIPGMTKRSWAVQLEILEKITNICEKYHIKWFAHCGTLLGAVRHRGFIPWDDDLDICMLQDDYIRFNEVAANELPKEFKILSLKTEDTYTNFLTRITNGSTINTTPEYLEINHGFPYVAGVDIFPLNYLYPDETKEEERRLKANTIWKITQSIIENRQTETDAEIIAQVESFVHFSVNRKLPLVAALYRVLEKLFFACDGKNSTQVSLMPFYILNQGHIYPLRYYKQAVLLPFESTQIRVPAAYEQILKIEYGSWETGYRKGGMHDYPFYIDQEQTLAGYRDGKVPYRYYFSPDDMKNPEREKKKLDADKNAAMLKLICDAHETIYKLIENHDTATAMRLLEKCQELAISVGTAIEEEQGEGFIAVKLLENYCEQVFKLHEHLAAGEICNSRQEYKELLKTISQVQTSYYDDRKIKREALFFPFRISEWESMKPFYQAALADPDFDTYVIPIPYYEKKDDGSFGAEHFDFSLYPQELNVRDYRTFDFQHHHPAMIVIQNPYDEFDSAISVHPFFYAKNLRKYTDRLVYVPYFTLDEIDPEDKKAMTNMPHFALTPGVIYSDKVIVESEQMKNLYIDILTAAAGENTRKKWEEKLIAGYIEAEDPATYPKERTDSRKKLLFYLSFSDFYANCESALKKLNDIIETFRERKDYIFIIWVADDDFTKKLADFSSGLASAYQEIVGEFLNENMGTYSESSSVDEAINACDAYYGSPGYIMNMCVRKGIPVMIKN